MPGPPPTPTVVKLLRGNPGQRRIRPEPQPEKTEQVPDAPDYLIGYAADEWYRVTPELHRLGLLTILDIPALAAYCNAYKVWRTAVEALHEMARRDPVMRGLVVKAASGGAIQNPLVLTIRQAANDMVRFAGEFGMTPVARARIGAGIYSNPTASKFDGLLA
jgi:P27 family predicted phage terminase small subunit